MRQGLAIVSKDTDFRERSYVEGFPPKIIWLDVGNAGTVAIAELLRRECQRIEEFERQEEIAVPVSRPARLGALHEGGRLDMRTWR